MKLETRALHPKFGVEVTGVDLTRLDEATHREILRLWQETPLVLIRRQLLSESDLINFSRPFGKLEIIVRKDILSRHNPEVAIVSNLKDESGTPLGGLGSYDLRWHTDQSYRTKPATGAIFYAIEVPPTGGDTSWSNTELAFEALPETLRGELAGYRGQFAYKMYDTDVHADPDVKEIRAQTPDAVHPMVLTHPVRGTRSLYLDPTQTYAIEGLPAERGDALLRELKAHAVRAEFTHTHQWRMGDVMMWDNSRLLHRRDPFDARMPRFMKRTTVFLDPKLFPVPNPA
jgi:taurine dioxygenase